MAELDGRGAVVFVHPNVHPTRDVIGLNDPGFSSSVFATPAERSRT